MKYLFRRNSVKCRALCSTLGAFTRALGAAMVLLALGVFALGVFTACSDMEAGEYTEEEMGFAKTMYTVRFDTDGGTLVAAQRVELRHMAADPNNTSVYPNAKKPTKEGGYKFDYWYKDDPTVRYDFLNTPVMGDITLHVKWIRSNEVSTPAIAWDATGNVVVITCADAGAAIHYTTDGSKPTANSAVYDATAKITLTETKTIKAIATLSGKNDSDVAEKDMKVWKVTFALNGGTGDIAAQPVRDGGKAAEPATPPTRERYLFNWWYAGTDDSVGFDFGSTAITKNTTLTAAWLDATTVMSPAIAWDPAANDKAVITCRTDGVTIYYTIDGTAPTTRSTAYTAAGITLTGTKTIKAIATKAGMNDSPVTTAVMTMYTVTFDVNDGKTAATTQAVRDGGKATKPGTDPTRSGCTFKYWSDSTGSEIDFANKTITANTTIKAKWLLGWRDIVTVTATSDDPNSLEFIGMIQVGACDFKVGTKPIEKGLSTDATAWWKGQKNTADSDTVADGGTIVVYAVHTDSKAVGVLFEGHDSNNKYIDINACGNLADGDVWGDLVKSKNFTSKQNFPQSGENTLRWVITRSGNNFTTKVSAVASLGIEDAAFSAVE